MTSQSLTTWLNMNMNIKSDDIDCGLAADFDGSLSGLGVELGSSTYNMSEALLALPVFKQENLEPGHMGSHGSQGVHFGNFYPHLGHRMMNQNGQQPQPRFPHNELNGFHGNAPGTVQFACQSGGQASSAVDISSGRLSRPQSQDDDEENACHSKEQHSPNSSDASGFSVDVLRGALLTTTEVNRLNGFHGNAPGTVQFACQSGGQASSAVDISSGRLSRPQSQDDEENACHSKEQHSPSSNDASGFSVDVLRGALLTTTEVNRCRYVLYAATSPATKMNEETLTYLNQGQSYEVKLTKYGDNSEYTNLKSIIRVVFHDRRLQYAEREQLQLWRMGRPGERLLDIDVPLSTGIHDVVIDSTKLNSISFKWDPNKECGVFVKVHCISTEFTPKKHGGEKGVPFRVQVETYAEDEDGYHLIHCASCQVKVFKPKGADRKQKTDRDKMEKRSGAEKEKYQPSYEVTVLSEIPLEQAQSYLDQLAQQELLHPNFKNLSDSKQWIHGASLPTTPEPPVERTSRISTSFSLGESFSRNSSVESLAGKPGLHKNNHVQPSTSTKNIKKKEEPVSEAKTPDETKPLSASDSAPDVQLWLQANRFPNYVKVFQNFAGSDLLRLTRDDLIQICGLVDGIRLNNALQSKAVRPKLTIYVSQCEDQSSKKPSQNRPQQPPPPPQKQQQQHHPQHQQEQQHTKHHKNHHKSRLTSGGGDGGRSSSSTTQVHTDRTSGDNSSSSTEGQPSQKISPSRGHGGGSTGNSTPQVASSKRQFRESEEHAEEEVTSSKKQRTRTLRMSQAEVYHALYFDVLSERALTEKISDLFSIDPDQIIEAFVAGPSGIIILITDDVVQNFVDQSRYHLEVQQDEDDTNKYRLLMKLIQ